MIERPFLARDLLKTWFLFRREASAPTAERRDNRITWPTDFHPDRPPRCPTGADRPRGRCRPERIRPRSRRRRPTNRQVRKCEIIRVEWPSNVRDTLELRWNRSVPDATLEFTLEFERRRFLERSLGFGYRSYRETQRRIETLTDRRTRKKRSGCSLTLLDRLYNIRGGGVMIY